MAECAKREGQEQERQCAVTRMRCGPDQLLRFVAGPDGSVVPDLKARLPGRGAWLTCSRDVIDKAVATRVFKRALSDSVVVSDELPEKVDELLVRDALQRLSLANKAGLVVCGFDKIAKELRSGSVTLVHASDAAADGCRKLEKLAVAVKGNEQPDMEMGLARNFNVEQLSLALGRPNVVHAALKHGAPSRKFLESVARLERFRAGSTVEVAA